MSKKVVDIDKFLDDKKMTFVIKGKTYEVTDIPADMEKMSQDGIDGLREGVAKMLGCPVEVVEDLGQGALVHILEEANANFLPSLGSTKEK